MDRISNLPENIREKSLTYLPIKEAGRTSILSSNWRHTWNSIADLQIWDFDCSKPDKTVKLVDVILLLHVGPIRKFDLLFKAKFPDAFDRWIHYLSRNGIKKIHLVMNHDFKYRIPSSFFSCSSLSSVSLCHCTIKLPKGYKGFKFLRFLELDDVSISVDCIKKLVSCCPILENLRLIKCWTRNILNIHAPNLKSLHLYRQIYEKESYKKKNPNRDFGGAPKLENLELGRRFIDQFLAEGLVPGKFPLIFQNLRELCLDWDLNEETEAKFILSLLQNSPNLQVFHIEMCRFPYHSKSPIPNFWESLKLQKFSFQRLQAVNILWNSSIEKIRPFIEIVLGSAPKLRKVNIEQTMKCDKDYEMCLKHLVSFPRASMEAQIIFESEVAKHGIGFEADYLD